jgi:16S rRNA (cytosine967-C5)-methyltransferase
VNRSRPAYAQGPSVRWRRDGKRSETVRVDARPARWSERGARDGGVSDAPRHANGGPATREHDTRRGAYAPAVAPATDGPSLPADPREAALRILHAVDTRSAFSDRLLDGAHARPGADPRDRALLHELVKGALRWRGRIDAALDARVHVGLANTQPWIRNVLRLGAYQILFLDRIPAHAAVDESVKLAHKYAHAGAAGLVNSVLRRLAEERGAIRWPEGDDAASLAAWGSHPLWIVERWLARFGPEETRALLAADNRAVPTGLRANTLKNDREQLMELLAREGVESRPGTLSPDLVWVEGHHSPGALHSFRNGLCTAQDESEALVGRVVAPQPHERVLDLCAAPGGKSTHLAELMHDDGEVWAMERDAHRVETLKTTLARLGTHSVHVVHGDGRTYEFPMPFDRVLVDAPCSGMGVLARRADARWRKGPEVLAEMPPVQLDLLRSAARRLVPGGLLVYSVCSFEPEETEHVVARFLSEHPGWTVESVAGAVPDAVVTPEGFMCTLPHRHGCDGAFAARIRKP